MPADAPHTAPRTACRSPRAALGAALAFTLLLAGDLALKSWAFHTLGDEPVDVHAVVRRDQPLPDRTVTLIPRVLALKLVVNRGAVFGVMAGHRALFIGATVLATAVIAWFFCRSRADERALHLALALILAGAVGNLYDRLRFAAVRDMLWLFPDVRLPFGLTWPGGASDLYPWVFNLADTYLLFGIAIILLRSIFTPAHTAEPAASERSA